MKKRELHFLDFQLKHTHSLCPQIFLVERLRASVFHLDGFLPFLHSVHSVALFSYSIGHPLVLFPLDSIPRPLCRYCRCFTFVYDHFISTTFLQLKTPMALSQSFWIDIRPLFFRLSKDKYTSQTFIHKYL